MSGCLKEKHPDLLYIPLPFSSSPNPNVDSKKASNVVTNYLQEVLPKKEKLSISADIKWRFLLGRPETKKVRHIRKKKSALSRKEKQKLNLLKLPKSSWNHEELESLRTFWSDYIEKVLCHYKKLPYGYDDPNWNRFSSLIIKAEFIGAEIKVIRSSVPNLVNLKGTVVLETKFTFQIVTPKNQLKIILKTPCIFEISLLNGKISFMGNSLLTKPSERAVKKIKKPRILDL